MLPLAITGTSFTVSVLSDNFYFHEGFRVFVSLYFKNDPVYNALSSVLFSAALAMWTEALKLRNISDPYAFNLYPLGKSIVEVTQSLRGHPDNDFTELRIARGNTTYFIVITVIVMTVLANLYGTFVQVGLI